MKGNPPAIGSTIELLLKILPNLHEEHAFLELKSLIFCVALLPEQNRPLFLKGRDLVAINGQLSDVNYKTVLYLSITLTYRRFRR